MRRPAFALFFAASLTALLWVVPYGHVVGRPLLWLSTLAHEGGHGVAALLAGGTWLKLQLFADGSGVATSRFPEDARAFVSFGGLVGPALLALASFVAGAFERPARLALGMGALACFTLDALVVEGAFAFGFVAALGVALSAVAIGLPARAAQVLLLFLAVQLSLSVFSRGDYLFAATATTGAGELPSDVATVAGQLGGPIALWGALIGLASVAALLSGLGFLVGVDRLVVRFEAWRARAST
jgi:hypothetical protein